MTRHVFADETKDRDYLLIASVHTSGDLDELRRLIRGLVLPGQYRVHMKKENDARKRLIGLDHRQCRGDRHRVRRRPTS